MSCPRCKPFLVGSLLVFLLWAEAAVAEDFPEVSDESQLDAFLPSQDGLEALLEKISISPDNLDNYYQYAKTAESLKQYKEAAWAYQAMLSSDPRLDRVRLDLSLIYIKQMQYVEARELMEGVLANNPPKPVQENITTVLQAMGDAGKKHILSGSLTVGSNFDTNAAAAPNSGSVTVFDTSIPLGGGQRKTNDINNFNSLSVNHTYQAKQLTNALSLRWKTNALTYITRQNELSRLNINLFSIRTGPELTYEPLGAKLEVDAVYNYLILDDHEYMRDPRMEISLEVPIRLDLSLLGGYIQEYRDFENSTTVTTYTERTGVARQGQLGAHYTFSESSAWDILFSGRHEDASEQFQINNQYAFLASNTHLFDDGFFAVCGAGLKRSLYPVADAITSASKRNDTEQSLQLMMGKRFDDYNLTLSLGYSYLKNRSSIQNYTYDNHRVTVSATKSF